MVRQSTRRSIIAAFPFLAGTLVAAIATATVADEPSDDPAVMFVRNFFRAMDAYDFGALERVFAPGAKIVTATGVELDAADYIAGRKAAPRTTPPVRELEDFQTIERGPVVVVSFANRTIRPSGPAAGDRTARETWILERSRAGFRALRTHFSMIAAPIP